MTTIKWETLPNPKKDTILYFISCGSCPFFIWTSILVLLFFTKKIQDIRYFTEMESAPRNVQVRTLSSSTMVITWEPPETPNGQVTVSIFVFIFIVFIFRFCIFVLNFFFVFQMEIVLFLLKNSLNSKKFGITTFILSNKR